MHTPAADFTLTWPHSLLSGYGLLRFPAVWKARSPGGCYALNAALLLTTSVASTQELIPSRRKLVHGTRSWMSGNAPNALTCHASTEVHNTRIYVRHLVLRDEPQQLAQACLAHTVSLLQRTLPDMLYRVRAKTHDTGPFSQPLTASLRLPG